MKLKKPKFWDFEKPNFTSNVLFPISKIFQFISQIKLKKSGKFKIKCICVGNIYLGGTGKTSLAIEIKKILDKENIKSCFIKKDYSEQIDEVKLLESIGKTFKDKNRINALKNAINENYQVAIFDDGLQDKSISYDLSLVCFNQKNMIGNGRLIPAGPLRETLANLEKYKDVIIIGNDENNIKFKNILLKKSQNINFYECTYQPINLKDFDKDLNYVAFSGIGNHVTFLDMLKKNNFNIIKDFEYADHYNYSAKDIKKIENTAKTFNAKIITTKKDFLRIEHLNPKNIHYINVYLKIIQIEKFKKKLKSIYEKN